MGRLHSQICESVATKARVVSDILPRLIFQEVEDVGEQIEAVIDVWDFHNNVSLK